ncbi:MAG: methyltransferase, partial [Cyanobacteria bacterium P01_C01_bin.147]
GEVEPLTLLFPQGDLSDLTRLYEDSTGARVMNSLVQQVVAATITQPPRPIRMLEIGAGTGGTTAHLLPQLQDVEYVFTDVSPLFLSKAQERFRDYPFVRYEVLDIERSPADQGFQEPFDLVIAANVLHATADLRQTLSHVRELLAPGGELILLEGTQPLLWLDLIFGLTEGWWKFSDRDLRPDYPLLSAEQWQALLAESGLTPARLQPESIQPDLPQTVMVAQRHGDTAAANQAATYLVLGEHLAGTATLAETLATQGINCLQAEWGDSSSLPSTNPFILDPLNAEDCQTLWQALTADDNIPSKVIYLASPSAAPNSAALERSCSGLLHLVQMLAKVMQPPQLYLVTQGVAQPPVVNPAQAPLWGLGRVIALEHPALRCCRVDLDPNATPHQQMADLATELTAQSGHEVIAYRQGQRWVARLGQFRLSPALELPNLNSKDVSFRLAISTKGTPDNLQLQPAIRRSPGPDEVEIRVAAAGLNFIDVLDTLDLLPFERDWLGVECAGEVVAVGANVASLAVGDRVIALAPGSFAQYVTVPAVLA